MSKFKKLRALFLSLIIIVGLVPVMYVVFRYDIINQLKHLETSTKVGAYSLLIVAGVFLGFSKKIISLVKEMEFSIFKSIISGILFLVPIGMALIISIGLSYIITDLIEVFEWVMGSNVIIFLILRPVWQYYNEKIKDQKEIDKMKEGFRSNERNI